jgi:type I restriction enzyme, R subunit
MNEAETRAELIDPALKDAGWGVIDGTRIFREYEINKGRIQGAGQRAKRDIADYVLQFNNKKLAVVEAKARGKADTEGVGQAKRYAEKLHIRYTYSTNGDGIYQIDMETGKEKYVDRYPTPQELWDMTYAKQNDWRDRFAAVPFEDKGGHWQARFYQEIAINKTLDAVADNEPRILLNLATGTGKTFISFQLAWKLFHSRWNLSREPSRRPRILFLADRNILADQAFNSFSAFSEDALVRIDPAEIRKKGRVPKNGSIFFTIFQTFMSGASGEEEGEPYFGEYPRDFFDFIAIDECHRGGANDEGSWRKILEYFEPAVQLGLTATPKVKRNANTYSYFGDPVYTYSLKEGINDGFLTPFRVKEISTTLDEYVYTSDDEILEGEVEEGKRYEESDFNKIIEIEQREAYRVKLFMDMIDQDEKTIVFCNTQDHALAVRNLINQMKKSSNPNYCVRVTANDGKIGEEFLNQFQDNELSIPTILTTSRKLSTGVDARNVRNIVLMKIVNNMIEFKQIIGRGTRLFEGKEYFTIYDFVKAHHNFNHPEWDGDPEPVITEPRGPREPKEPKPDDEKEKPKKVKIKLRDGKERTLDNMVNTSFWDASGKPISSSEFLSNMFGDLPEFFKNETELRSIWAKPDTRKTLLANLSEKGYGSEQLGEMKKLISAEKSDLYDVLAYVAFMTQPITREERVAEAKIDILKELSDDKEQAFIDFVLEQYVKQGVCELDQEKLPELLTLKYHSIPDAIAEVGNIAKIKTMFIEFQKYLYKKANVA